MSSMNLTSTLTPALGYFGSSPADALVVRVQNPIRGVRIQLNEEKPEILNLKGLQLFKNGNPLTVDLATVQVFQSSIYQNNSRYGKESLLAMRGIHTSHEVRPSWEIVFPALIDVDEIKIFNREDEWGVRSRTLLVSILSDIEQAWIIIHDSKSAESLLASFFAATYAATGVEITAVADPHSIREVLTRSISAKILAGALSLSSVDWRKIVHFVDIWSGHSITDAELTIVAAKVYFEKTFHGKSNLKDTAFMLRRPGEIIALQEKVNDIAKIYGGSDVLIISRHGLQSSKLLSKAGEFIAHIKAVTEILIDFEPVLAYGTLLGAIREHSFIAHDDDVDLLCRVTAVDYASAEIAMRTVFERLKALDFDVVRCPDSLNAQVIDKKLGVSVDVFPCWDVDGATFLHMERMNIRSIPTDVLYPSRSLTFYGVELPVPNQAEAFLHHRYGDGWRVSNQFFEWPWKLSE